MKRPILYASLFCIAGTVINPSCQETSVTKASIYHYIEPVYDNIQLQPKGESLHFPLGEYSYNRIGSFNYFTHKGKAFIAFFDRNAKSLNTYDFTSQQLVQKIPLKNWFIGETFKKAYTYVINFDSIFIVTDKRLLLVDSSSAIKKNIQLLPEPEAKAICANETPGVLENNILYLGTQPVVSQTSLKAHQRWRVLCSFNLLDDTKELHYQLPEIYQKNLYGYPFLEYSYCINDKGNFVFSFPADTNIYETNLAEVHNAYYAKSRFQIGAIVPVSKKAMENHESFKEYSIRDSYGAIFYDPYKRRYLRLAKQKVNETDLLAKNRIRKKSIIIFNEQFKIIGEAEIKDKFEFGFIFFTPNGIYARVKFSDEQALHFIRLDYSKDPNDPLQLTQNKLMTPQ